MAVCTTVTYTSTVNSNILYKMKYWWEFYLAESCNWWIKYMSHLMRANLPYLAIKHVQVDGYCTAGNNYISGIIRNQIQQYKFMFVLFSVFY